VIPPKIISMHHPTKVKTLQSPLQAPTSAEYVRMREVPVKAHHWPAALKKDLFWQHCDAFEFCTLVPAKAHLTYNKERLTFERFPQRLTIDVQFRFQRNLVKQVPAEAHLRFFYGSCRSSPRFPYPLTEVPAEAHLTTQRFPQKLTEVPAEAHLGSRRSSPNRPQTRASARSLNA
jgi:hypothetical protein